MESECLYCTYKEKGDQATENRLRSAMRRLAESHRKDMNPRCDASNESTSWWMHWTSVATKRKDSLLTSSDNLQQLYDLKVMLTVRPGTIDPVPAPPRTGSLEVRARDKDISHYTRTPIQLDVDLLPF